MTERRPHWFRWLVLFPVSLAAGYLLASMWGTVAGWLGDSAAWSYVAAAVSGAAFVVASCICAYWIAPRHKRTVATVLGIFILGDLSFVHIVVPELFADSALPEAAGNQLSLILAILRTEDYGHLSHGGLVRVVGAALAGLGLIVASRGRAAKEVR